MQNAKDLFKQLIKKKMLIWLGRQVMIILIIN